MTAYSTASWQGLFEVAAEANATLTGLLFVAVSINIEQILDYPGLPQRALQTLMILVGMTVIGLLGLAPDQSSTAYGIEVLIVGAMLTLAIGALVRSSVRASSEQKPAYIGSQVMFAFPSLLLLSIAGASLLARTGGGLYWVLAAVCAALIGAVGNAWVLLIEILR